VRVIMLTTGSTSIGENLILLSRRHARILGAAAVVSRLVIASIGVLEETGRFEAREIAMGGFFAFFVAVGVLGTIMTVVQLVGWAREIAMGGRGTKAGVDRSLRARVSARFPDLRRDNVHDPLKIPRLAGRWVAAESPDPRGRAKDREPTGGCGHA
jgi:hypothetical protein